MFKKLRSYVLAFIMTLSFGASSLRASDHLMDADYLIVASTLSIHFGSSSIQWLHSYLEYLQTPQIHIPPVPDLTPQIEPFLHHFNQDILEDLSVQHLLAPPPLAEISQRPEGPQVPLGGHTLLNYLDQVTSFNANGISVQIDGQILQISIDQFTTLFCEHYPVNNGNESSMTLAGIIGAMIASRQNIVFSTMLDAFREIAFRLHMIERFDLFLECTDYNNDGDDYILNSDQWSPIICFSESEMEENAAFQPHTGTSPFVAINGCYLANKKSPTNILDCCGSVVTHIYGSLAFAEGPQSFDQLVFSIPNVLTIAPWNVNFDFSCPCDRKKRGKGKQRIQNNDGETLTEHPLFENEILIEFEIKKLSQLLPGDVVYFMNHPTYEQFAPNGSAAGEYCIYLGTNAEGDQVFTGLGVDGHKTYSKMLASIRKSYEEDTRRKFPKGRAKSKDRKDIMDDSFPSMESRIYVMHAYRMGGFLSTLHGKK